MSKKRGRPKLSTNVGKKKGKPIKKNAPPPIKKPLHRAMDILRKLNKNGTINSLSEIRYDINAPRNYIYVSFKIPIKDVKK